MFVFKYFFYPIFNILVKVTNIWILKALKAVWIFKITVSKCYKELKKFQEINVPMCEFKYVAYFQQTHFKGL